MTLHERRRSLSREREEGKRRREEADARGERLKIKRTMKKLSTYRKVLKSLCFPFGEMQDERLDVLFPVRLQKMLEC